MKFRCIDIDQLDGVLTKGKVYAGEMAYHRGYIKIYRCDDKHVGFFEPKLFEEVQEEKSVEPIYSIYTYSLDSKGKGE